MQEGSSGGAADFQFVMEHRIVNFMMLTAEQNHLRWQIEEVSFRCLHAIEYFDGVTGFDPGNGDYWRFSQNCFGETACLNWCHIFNSDKNDPVHYRNLFGDDQLMPLGEHFSYENTKQRLIKSADLNETSYLVFREEMIDFRNKFAAHREFTIGSIRFPQLDHARAMCLEMREILKETVEAELLLDPKNMDLKYIKKHFLSQSNQWLLKKCKRELAQLKKSIHSD